MKLFHRSYIALILLLLLLSTAGAYAHQDTPSHSGSGISTDGLYLFVMEGDTLYEYNSEDLSLITTIALPKPNPPADNDSQTASWKFWERNAERVTKIKTNRGSDNQTGPLPAGSGLCTDGTYLFMLRGATISQYTLSNMKLVKSVELPKPEPSTN